MHKIMLAIVPMGRATLKATAKIHQKFKLLVGKIIS